MPRLDAFQLEITTGANPGPERPRYSINGFPLEFDSYDGSTEPGATLRVAGSPRSFPHALLLSGPEPGTPPWDIARVIATYHCAGDQPYTVHLGAVTLDDDSDLNIWHPKPVPVLDV